jgi:hypothetical protein
MMFAGLQHPVDFAVRILEIAEIHTPCWAYGDTSRTQSFLHAMDTKSAFIGISIRMDEPGIVRTRSNACFASDTYIVLNQDYSAKVMDMTRAGRTAIHTRRTIAVIAPFRTYFHVE